MKVTIQTEPLCTVIRKPFNAEWVKEQLALGIPVKMEFTSYGAKTIRECTLFIYEDSDDTYLGVDHPEDSIAVGYEEDTLLHTITILPPLPRNIKYTYDSESVIKLLASYRAAGLRVCGKGTEFQEQYDGEYDYPSECVVHNEIPECFTRVWIAEITHCIDSDGNKHDIAIKGEI